MMDDIRPTNAYTLPRNFQFHDYSNGSPPKTPERGPRSEVELSMPEAPPPRYIIRRKKRRSTMRVEEPAVGLGLDSTEGQKPVFGLGLAGAVDDPVPSIELPDDTAPSFSSQGPQEHYSSNLLGTFSDPRQMALRTPSPQITRPRYDWSTPDQESLGDDIDRPASGFSLPSDSSDNSDLDSDDDVSYGGSMTSPESDIGYLRQPTKPGLPAARLTYESPSPVTRRKRGQTIPRRKQSHVNWSNDMDNHIWLCYLKYMNDPTVTPFKNWPGSSPPLGVCRRVAREAKASWKAPKTKIISSDRNNPSGRKRGTSVDTLMLPKSGSNTPTGPVAQAAPAWPKSDKSTRKRLRHICKTRTIIAPHYQRMLKSRSPEPFSSSSRGNSHRPSFTSPELFATRDVHISLATSTSVTMQPDGPLQQLTRSSGRARSNSTWFNDTSVAWASPAPQPSSEMDNSNQEAISRESMADLVAQSQAPRPYGEVRSETTNRSAPHLGDHAMHDYTPISVAESASPRPFSRRQTERHFGRPDSVSGTIGFGSGAPPRLGSPFHHRHHHTWTASSFGLQRSRRPARPALNTFTTAPRLSSPFEEHGTFPYPSNHKRRAPNQLEDDDNANSRSRHRSAERDPFYEAPPRRVRARGFSYGDALTQGRLPSTHTPPPDGPRTIHRFTTPPPLDGAPPPFPPPAGVQGEPRRLASPFAGISSRPSRARRVSPTMSLSNLESPAYPSIDETLNRTSGGPSAH